MDVGPIPVFSGIHAEIARAGMRTPDRLNAKPIRRGTSPDGGTTWGGGTWSFSGFPAGRQPGAE